MPKIRIEFTSLGAGRGRLGGQVDLPEGEPLGSMTLEVAATPTASGSRPVVPSGAGTVFATLLATEAALYVDIGVAPDPASEPRLLLLPGRPRHVHVTSGHAISAMLAADVPVGAESGAVAVTDRSGTLAAGGAAQQACPANPWRRFLLIANPDDARTFTFRTDAVAGTGSGNILVGPGGAFVFDKLVPAGAVSIFAAAAGQPYTVKEA